MLDIYVVSLSASWISDATLTTLMGRVPARCILLLEDLDAAFTRSTSREKSNKEDKEDKEKDSNANCNSGNNANNSSGTRRRNKNGDQLSDVNTLSLSGLLNALDGVAAAEGRILFAYVRHWFTLGNYTNRLYRTTNHLERLDTALCRPGRMDVWVEFKNASKWQAEALFRNFFPSAEDEKDEPLDEEQIEREMAELSKAELSKAELKKSTGLAANPTSTSPRSLWSMFSPTSASSQPDLTSSDASSEADVGATARARTLSTPNGKPKDKQFGDSNHSYLPPPVEDHILASQHSAKPLDAATLNKYAKKFADCVPEEEFSVAALQGCKHLKPCL